MMAKKHITKDKTISPQQLTNIQHKTYQEQELDVYQDYQQRKSLVLQKILEIIESNRLITEKDQKQIDFLDVIQENIYKNMIAIDPTCFKELLNLPNPPVCFQCSVFALKILVQNGDQIGDLVWQDFQASIKNKEIEFLGLIYSFQQLTIETVFTRTNIMKAKNELLKYLIEANLSKWISNEEKLPFRQKYGIQIQNFVQLAENIIGFVEVFDQVVQALRLETMKFNPNLKTLDLKKPQTLDFEDIMQYKIHNINIRAPASSLQHSPRYEPKMDQLFTTPLIQQRDEHIDINIKRTKKQPKIIDTTSQVIMTPKQKTYKSPIHTKFDHKSTFSKETQKTNKSSYHIEAKRRYSPSQINQTQPHTFERISFIEPLEINIDGIEKMKLCQPVSKVKQINTPQSVRNRDSNKQSISENSLAKQDSLTPLKQSPPKIKSPMSYSQQVSSFTQGDRQNDLNLEKLREAIQQNEENIKNYDRDQLELNWKIKKENALLKINLEKLQEYDDNQRQEQWRSNSISSKAEQDRNNKYNKQDMKEFQRELRMPSKTDSLHSVQISEKDSHTMDLQMNLQRFHKILRNK